MWACSAKWKKLGRKTVFYDELKGEWDRHSVGDLVMWLGDISGHVGRYIDGLDGVHGGYGVKQRNLEGRMLFVLSGEGTMCVICV